MLEGRSVSPFRIRNLLGRTLSCLLLRKEETLAPSLLRRDIAEYHLMNFRAHFRVKLADDVRHPEHLISLPRQERGIHTRSQTGLPLRYTAKTKRAAE